MYQQRIASFEAVIVDLLKLDRTALRALWTQHLGKPPKHQSIDLMRRRLAYELQVQAFGGLNSVTRRRLERLHAAFKINPNWQPLPYRHLAVGTVLTRIWKGKTQTVSVLDEGFEYAGRRYGSLSEVAQIITGGKRSGPSFFGFRERTR